MRRTKIILAVAITLTILMFVGYSWVTADKSIAGAVLFHLPVNCQVIYFDTSLQPVQTIAVGCPGVDMIRFWPLPIQFPWFEDDEF